MQNDIKDKNSPLTTTFTWSVKLNITPEPSPMLIFATIDAVLLAARSARRKGRWAGRRASVLILLGVMGAASPGSAHADAAELEPDRLAVMTPSQLIPLLDSTDGKERASATAELFRRGLAILPDLEAAGAKPIGPLPARRLDTVYSLIKGLPPGRYTRDAFGMVLVKPDRATVDRLGKRYGFNMLPFPGLSGESWPNCYVELKPGKTLEDVLRAVMCDPSVESIKLNHYTSCHFQRR